MPWIKPPSNIKKDSLRAIFVPFTSLARPGGESRTASLGTREYVERPALQLLVPDHGHIGDLLELGVADLRLHPLRLAVDLDPQISIAKALGELGDRLQVPVRDRDEDDLYRS